MKASTRLMAPKTTRRHFLGAASLAGAAAHTFSALANAAPLGLPIGCQTYPIRQELGKDFDGTLKQLASIGYRSIEMCSPPGYERAGYGPLITLKASELREKIHSAGMVCESCHYQYKELKESLDDRIVYAKELGLKHMVVSTFSVPKDGKLSDWARAASELNPIAERIQKAGLRTAFHNHNVEFTQLDGVLIYDKLMSELDPKLVTMQFQVWVVSMGVDPVALFEKYPGRFSSLHLQDYSPNVKGMVAIGQGTVDWKKLFAAAKKSGLKNYFVEMDLELMKTSYPFLRDLKV